MPLSLLSARILLWLLAPPPTPPPDGVQWHAPPGCPDRSALLAAVERRLGRPLAAEVTLDALVTRDAVRGYVLRLTLAAGTRSETREVHDPSCAALSDAVALRVVAALESTAPVVPPAPDPAAPDPAALDPAAPTPGASPAPDPSALTPTPEVSPAPVASSPAPVDPSRFSQPGPGDRFTGPGGVLRLHGGAEYGAAPKATGAVGLAVGLLWPRLRLELHGTALAPRTASRPPGSVTAGLFAAALHGCGRLGRGALEVPLCLGLEVGAVRGEASRLPAGRAALAWWVAAVLGPGLAWHASARVSVWASLQLVLAPVRPSFEQGAGDAAAPIFTPSFASGRLLLGVELRLRDRW